MKRILYVTAVGERGGLEVVLLNVLRSLEASRYLPYVVLLEGGPLLDDVRQTGAKTHVLDGGRVRNVGKGIRTVAELVKIIHEEGIDVVHSWNAKAHLYGGLAAAISRVPSLYHLQNVPRFSLSRDGVVSSLSVMIPARRTVGCSLYVADSFKRLWGSRRDVCVVHNGTMAAPQMTGAARSLRHELLIPDRAPIVLLSARLQRWKGVHVFIDAAHRILRERSGVYFVVVGGTLFGLDQDYEVELQRQVRNLGLEGAVRFAGFRSDVWQFYAEADIVVHCSIEPEPFGMVLVEAMASGKPVIAADAGGAREIIESDVTGVLIPPNDPERLAAALTVLLSDAELRGAMGKAGALRVGERFTATRMTQQLQALYEEVSCGH